MKLSPYLVIVTIHKNLNAIIVNTFDITINVMPKEFNMHKVYDSNNSAAREINTCYTLFSLTKVWFNWIF